MREHDRERLERAGFTSAQISSIGATGVTLQELLAMSDQDLLNVRGIGSRTIEMLTNLLLLEV